jgi:MFS family permease
MPNPYLAVLAIVLGVAILQLANGVFATFLSLRMTIDGLAASSVGLVVTGYAAGFLVGCLFVPRVIAHVGHIRAFAAFAALTAALVLCFAVRVDTALWTVLRILTGFAGAGLMTVAESWLNERTPRGARGRVIGFYMVFTKLAFAGGQLLITVGDLGGLVFFMLASGCYSLSLLPVTLTRGSSPQIPDLVTLGVRELFRIAPAGVIGAFAAGLMNSAVINISPVYLVRIGYDTGTIAGLLVMMQIGSLTIQWPLGWISDRIDRRKVIALAAGGSAALALTIAFLGPSAGPWLYLLFALWGGFALSFYAVCVAHANDFARPEQMVPLSSSLLLAWASGSVVGPSAATATMEVFGPDGLFFYAAAIGLGLTLFVVFRMTRRAPVPVDLREPFVNVPATSPAIHEIHPRAEADESRVRPAAK